jgi:hypothetical protein
MPPAVHKLTDKQQAFILGFTSEPATLGNGAASARAAGYSEKTAGEIARQLLALPHIRDAITAANREQISGRIATKAVALLERVIDDESVPIRERIVAAKSILDRGGFMPPSLAERAREVADDKPLNEMTRDELARFIEKERAAIDALEAAADGPKMIDVTPDSAPPNPITDVAGEVMELIENRLPRVAVAPEGADE